MTTLYTSEQARLFVQARLRERLADDDYYLSANTWRTWCASSSKAWRFTQHREWAQDTPASHPVLMYAESTLVDLVGWLAKNLIRTPSGDVRIAWKADMPGKRIRGQKAVNKENRK